MACSFKNRFQDTPNGACTKHLSKFPYCFRWYFENRAAASAALEMYLFPCIGEVKKVGSAISFPLSSYYGTRARSRARSCIINLS